VDELPVAVRTMLGGVGVSSKAADIKGAALASYLLFEHGYTRELMALGYADATRQSRNIHAFFGWSAPDAAAESPAKLQHDGKDRRRDPLRLRN
jgi:NTE family protein